jgi:peptide/nickel transport system substrate-binding protein
MRIPVSAGILAVASLLIFEPTPAAVDARKVGALTGDALVSSAPIGVSGGQLVIAQRAEPKTFNPLTAMDGPSREVVRRLTADLIHINRHTLVTEPALARTWSVSADGRHYLVTLRRGLRFSDGHPCDADDVVFSFQAYLDERAHSPQRDLLMVDGQPIALRRVDELTIAFDLPAPLAAAERLFDSIAILPRHLLQQAARDGTLDRAWSLTTDPSLIAGLGPFRLVRHVPGERIVLERNPYYWKVDARGQSLPYLARLVFVQVPDDNAQALRFQAADTDVVTRLTADDFDLLAPGQASGGYRLADAGPGFEYNFLFFNLGDAASRGLKAVARRQAWFRDRAFRQAVSAAVDRDAIVRIVYRGRGVSLSTHVTPANRLWRNDAVPKPVRSLEHARALLSDAGFRWSGDGGLHDASGAPVEFTLLVAAGNQPRMQMATILQDDLKQIGIRVAVASLEFRTLLNRVLETRDYDACVLGLASGDADPSSEMNVWLSSGQTHLWNPGQREPATRWEAEIDGLMRRQLTVLDARERKRIYDRVQAIVSEELPIICLASPDVLVGARAGLGNFRPAVLDHYVLSNVDELFWRDGRAGGER